MVRVCRDPWEGRLHKMQVVSEWRSVGRKGA